MSERQTNPIGSENHFNKLYFNYFSFLVDINESK